MSASFSKLISGLTGKTITVLSSGSPSPFGSLFVRSPGSSEVSKTDPPSGEVPSTIALLITSALLISVCVSVYSAVKVVPSLVFGSRFIGPPETLTIGSDILIVETVTLPVLLTLNA